MSRSATYLLVSGFNYNLPKTRPERLHRTADIHDALVVDRLKSLFEPSGTLFERTIGEDLPSVGSPREVRAILIFFADRFFDFRNQQKRGTYLRTRPSQAIELRFGTDALQKGKIRIPDNEALRGVMERPRKIEWPRKTPVGMDNSERLNRVERNWWQRNLTKLGEQFGGQIAPYDPLTDREPVGEHHYFLDSRFAPLFGAYRRKDTKKGVGNYARKFGFFLRLQEAFEAGELELLPDRRGRRRQLDKLRDDFLAAANSYRTAKRYDAVKGVLSITDVYKTVSKIQSEGNRLLELSIFSHGWAGGAALVNSSDRSALLYADDDTRRGLKPKHRDPYDKDTRAKYDFPTLRDWSRLNRLGGLPAAGKYDPIAISNAKIRSELFTEASRVRLWGCNAAEKPQRILRRVFDKKHCRENLALVRKAMQAHLATRHGPNIGRKALALHLKGLRREVPQGELCIPKSSHVLPRCYIGPEPGTSAPNGLRMPWEFSDAVLSLTFSASDGHLLYPDQVDFSDTSDLEAYLFEKDGGTMTKAGFAVIVFGPNLQNPNRSDPLVWTSQAELDTFVKGADPKLVAKAINSRRKGRWTTNVLLNRLVFWLDVPSTYAWRLAYEWPVRVFGSLLGTGSLFGSRRTDRVFKKRVADLKRVGKDHRPLNDIKLSHKRFGGGGGRDAYDIVTFFRDVCRIPIDCNDALDETRGYGIYDRRLIAFQRLLADPTLRGKIFPLREHT